MYFQELLIWLAGVHQLSQLIDALGGSPAESAPHEVQCPIAIGRDSWVWEVT